jgi:tRNA nucleotidyltransferase (CCA-adding enzyme)
MEETDFIKTIKKLGGRAYAAGGWVRDREMGIPPRDKDYVVAGVAENSFNEAFPCAFRAGRAFPVYRLEIGGQTRDVALARGETKSGRGYRGFAVSYSPLTAIEDDLLRRDTTINAMAVDLETGELLDPCGGLSDLRRGVIRAVSERFRDDPVRALRAARQAAQLGFRIERETIRLMSECHDELSGEPGERLANELRLALSCPSPSVFFTALRAAGLLDVTFPSLHALAARGVAFSRAMDATDRAATLAERAEIRFAALACSVGLEINLVNAEETDIKEWEEKTPLPRLWAECAIFASHWGKKAFEIKEPDEARDLIEGLIRHPVGPDGLEAVMLSVFGKLPPVLQKRREIESAIRSIRAQDAPSDLAGERLGAWLRERRNDAVARVMNYYSGHAIPNT